MQGHRGGPRDGRGAVRARPPCLPARPRASAHSGCRLPLLRSVDEIIELAADADVSFLVIGDAFGATTHTDLMLRAQAQGVEVSVVHNASIMNAIGCCGLQLYNYGQAVSICFFRGPGTFWPDEAAWRGRFWKVLNYLYPVFDDPGGFEGPQRRLGSVPLQ